MSFMIAPSIRHIPGIENAVEGMHRFLRHDRILSLSQHEEPIRAETVTIGPEHIPYARTAKNPYRDSVLGFFAALTAIENGPETLRLLAGHNVRPRDPHPQKPIFAEELIRHYVRNALPLFTTDWVNCAAAQGFLSGGSRRFILSLAWLLKDSVVSYHGRNPDITSNRVWCPVPDAITRLKIKGTRIMGIKLTDAPAYLRHGLFWVIPEVDPETSWSQNCRPPRLAEIYNLMLDQDSSWLVHGTLETGRATHKSFLRDQPERILLTQAPDPKVQIK